jgi:hypothetical protein
MPTVAKTATFNTLDLPEGDHLVLFHVEADTISYQVTSSQPDMEKIATSPKQFPTGFLKKWGGTAQKVEDTSDEWLTHLNDKHLR